MQIAIASDHGGYKLKEEVKKYLASQGHKCMDFGCNSEESCDYPDFGFMAAESVAKGECERGIVVCRSGIGMSIVANKVKGVRAALCTDKDTAAKSREHNDANVLVLSADRTDLKTTEEIIDTWLATKFTAGRHIKRIDKISEYEERRKYE